MAFADEGAACSVGFAGAACVVVLRGRGFGSGTPSAAYGASVNATAPSSARLRRLRRAALAKEGANDVTGGLYGESFKSLHFGCSALNMWKKHQMC